MGQQESAMASGYSVLVLAIVASVVAGKPQATADGAAPTEQVITCDCVRQINAEVMPDVNTAINELTSSVDELFTLANATEINPVGVRHICLFCGWVRRYRKSWYWPKKHYHHCDHHKCYHCHHYCPHCCKSHRWKRQAENLPVCPIDEVVATAQTARDGTKLVSEIIAGIRADPKEVVQELLDDISALYKDVNESVKNLRAATDPNSSDCQDNAIFRMLHSQEKHKYISS